MVDLYSEIFLLQCFQYLRHKLKSESNVSVHVIQKFLWQLYCDLVNTKMAAFSIALGFTLVLYTLGGVCG